LAFSSGRRSADDNGVLAYSLRRFPSPSVLATAAAAILAGLFGCGSPEPEVARQDPAPALEPAPPPADVHSCSLGYTERGADGAVVTSGASIPAQLTRERCDDRCATAWQRLLGNKPEKHLFTARCWFGDEGLDRYAGVGGGAGLAASAPGAPVAEKAPLEPGAPADPTDAEARARELARGLPFNTYEERGRILRELAALGEPAVPALVAELGSQDEAVREGAAETLEKIGSPRAVEGLVAALSDESSRVRSSVVDALGAIGDSRAVPRLIGMISDANDAVASSAVDALGEIGDARAVEPLRAALARATGRVAKASAAEALGKIGEPSAVPDLIEALDDDDMFVRSTVARALGQIGDARALPELRRIHERERSSRGATGHAIREIERAEQASRQPGTPAAPAP